MTVELTEEQKAYQEQCWTLAVEKARVDVAAGFIFDHQEVVRRANLRRARLLAEVRSGQAQP